MQNYSTFLWCIKIFSKKIDIGEFYTNVSWRSHYIKSWIICWGTKDLHKKGSVLQDKLNQAWWRSYQQMNTLVDKQGKNSMRKKTHPDRHAARSISDAESLLQSIEQAANQVGLYCLSIILQPPPNHLSWCHSIIDTSKELSTSNILVLT